MLKFLDDLDREITESALRQINEDDDFQKAIVSIWRVMSYNVFPIVVDFHDKRKFYVIVSCTRLLMESVADAKHLSNNRNESSGYFRNQEKIAAELKKRGDRAWEIFANGSVKYYGKLSQETLKRVENAFGRKSLVAYSYYCFYSHPNIAGVSWLTEDTNGRSLKNVFPIVTMVLLDFLSVAMEARLIQDSGAWKRRLKEVHNVLEI